MSHQERVPFCGAEIMLWWLVKGTMRGQSARYPTLAIRRFCGLRAAPQEVGLSQAGLACQGRCQSCFSPTAGIEHRSIRISRGRSV